MNTCKKTFWRLLGNGTWDRVARGVSYGLKGTWMAGMLPGEPFFEFPDTEPGEEIHHDDNGLVKFILKR